MILKTHKVTCDGCYRNISFDDERYMDIIANGWGYISMYVEGRSIMRTIDMCPNCRIDVERMLADKRSEIKKVRDNPDPG